MTVSRDMLVKLCTISKALLARDAGAGEYHFLHSNRRRAKMYILIVSK